MNKCKSEGVNGDTVTISSMIHKQWEGVTRRGYVGITRVCVQYEVYCNSHKKKGDAQKSAVGKKFYKKKKQ